MGRITCGRRHRLALFVFAVVVACSLACPLRVWAENNLVYEIFVRSFASGDAAKGDGDLKGVVQKLDYLNDGVDGSGKDLEAGILWLMPIFPSTSYHGYDVTDFRRVNPEYGDMRDLDALIAAAHDRKVRVILDVPFNHTSDQHPWFKDAVEDRNGRRAFYYMYDDDGRLDKNWHTVRNAAGKRLKYFGHFGSNMPDLNFNTPAVREEVKEVARFWLAEHKVDGFRLDAAKHIFGWSDGPDGADILANNAWWREFSTFVEGVRPGAVLVGEVLGDERLLARHAWGLNALVDEPFMDHARDQLVRPKAGFMGRWQRFLKDADAEHPDAPYDSFLYLASHDRNPRLASDLEHRLGGAVTPRYRLGLCLLMSAGRYPMLYNGDELMQRGWKWNGNGPAGESPGDGTGVYDETLREPLPWHKSGAAAPQADWQPGGHAGFLPKFDRPNDGVSVEEQEQDARSTLALARALGQLRGKLPDFANGALGTVIDDTAEWMVFERVNAGTRHVVLLNLTDNGKNYRFHAGWHPGLAGSQLLFWSDGQSGEFKDLTAANTRIEGEVFVPPFGMVLLRP